MDGSLPHFDRPEPASAPRRFTTKGKRAMALDKRIRGAAELSCTETCVLFVLASYAKHRTGLAKCFPSVTTIANGAKISRSSAQRVLRSLEQKKWIRVEARHDPEEPGSLSRLYTITPPEKPT